MNNADTIRNLYSLAVAAKYEELFGVINEIMSPEVVLHEATSMPFGGEFLGKPAVLEALGNVMAFVDASSLEPERILSDGDCVVVLFPAVQWRAEGFEALGLAVPAATPFHEVWTFRDGQVVDLRPWYFDQATVVPA